MTQPLRLLLSDLRHHAETTVGLAVVLAVACALAMFAWSVGSGGVDALTAGMDRLGADLAVVPAGEGDGVRAALVTGTPLRRTFADASEAIRGVDGVTAATAQLFMSSAKASCCDEGDVLIVGMDPDSDFVVTPWVLRGRQATDDSIVAGAAIKRAVGTPLTFYGERRTVSAVLARTGWGYFDRAAFASLPSVRDTAARSLTRDDVVDVEIPQGHVSIVFVRAQKPTAAAAAIKDSIPDVDVVELGGLGARLRIAGAAATRAAAVAAALAALVAAALVAVVVYASVARRRRDLSLLRALGMSASGLTRACVAEVALVAAPASVLGALGGWATAALFSAWFTYRAQLPLLAPAPADGMAMVLVVGVCATAAATASAYWPARAVVSRDPHEGLAS